MFTPKRNSGPKSRVPFPPSSARQRHLWNRVSVNILCVTTRWDHSGPPHFGGTRPFSVSEQFVFIFLFIYTSVLSPVSSVAHIWWKSSDSNPKPYYKIWFQTFITCITIWFIHSTTFVNHGFGISITNHFVHMKKCFHTEFLINRISFWALGPNDLFTLYLKTMVLHSAESWGCSTSVDV